MRYVVMVMVTIGSGFDLETYPEEYSGIEWTNLENAKRELKDARKLFKDVYIDEREVTRC